MRECQKNANKKWSEENRERSNYLKNKSACKTFIRKRATLEDLEEISKIIFSEQSIERKRIEIRKLRKNGLDNVFINMFMKLLEYVAQI